MYPARNGLRSSMADADHSRSRARRCRSRAIHESCTRRQVGTPLEIYERPNCRFVADFIGETNFLDGKVTEINGEFATVLVDGSKLFVGRINGNVRTGAEAMISVRPEKMLLQDKQPSGPNTYEAQVKSVGYVGSDTRIMVTLGTTVLDIWEQNSLSTLDPNFFFKPGDSAWVTFKPENALVLAN